jgi:N-terminal acetyltransferase B complex non-catalytic subunit
MELIELKFIFDKSKSSTYLPDTARFTKPIVHHDNRDFEIFPNYQPKESQGFNQQTLLFGKSEGVSTIRFESVNMVSTYVFNVVGMALYLP